MYSDIIMYKPYTVLYVRLVVLSQMTVKKKQKKKKKKKKKKKIHANALN